jgi:hypothetical protein
MLAHTRGPLLPTMQSRQREAQLQNEMKTKLAEADTKFKGELEALKLNLSFKDDEVGALLPHA